jgi:hypothetical protein
MEPSEVQEDKSPEKIAASESKPSWKRYAWISLCFAIAGAIPLFFSLNAIFTNIVGSSSENLAGGFVIIGFWFWLLITLPFSLILGVAAVAFAGYAIKLTKGEQPFKVRAQVVMAIGCVEILTPIAIFVFFVLPLSAAISGH